MPGVVTLDLVLGYNTMFDKARLATVSTGRERGQRICDTNHESPTNHCRLPIFARDFTSARQHCDAPLATISTGRERGQTTVAKRQKKTKMFVLFSHKVSGMAALRAHTCTRPLPACLRLRSHGGVSQHHTWPEARFRTHAQAENWLTCRQ